MLSRRGFISGLLAAPAFVVASRLDFGVPKKLVTEIEISWRNISVHDEVMLTPENSPILDAMRTQTKFRAWLNDPMPKTEAASKEWLERLWSLPSAGDRE